MSERGEYLQRVFSSNNATNYTVHAKDKLNQDIYSLNMMNFGQEREKERPALLQ